MKDKISILNVMTYTKENKNTGEVKENSRIEFIFANPKCIQNSSKYLGYQVITTYCKGNILKHLQKENIATPIEVEFKEVSNYNDPLASKKMLKSIIINGNVIDLL